MTSWPVDIKSWTDSFTVGVRFESKLKISFFSYSLIEVYSILNLDNFLPDNFYQYRLVFLFFD